MTVHKQIDSCSFSLAASFAHYITKATYPKGQYNKYCVFGSCVNVKMTSIKYKRPWFILSPLVPIIISFYVLQLFLSGCWIMVSYNVINSSYLLSMSYSSSISCPNSSITTGPEGKAILRACTRFYIHVINFHQNCHSWNHLNQIW